MLQPDSLPVLTDDRARDENASQNWMKHAEVLRASAKNGVQFPNNISTPAHA